MVLDLAAVFSDPLVTPALLDAILVVGLVVEVLLGFPGHLVSVADGARQRMINTDEKE